MNYTVDEENATLTLRSQTDDERMFLRRLVGQLHGKLVSGELVIAVHRPSQDDNGDTPPDKAALVQQYADMSEEDLLTTMAERDVKPPKKKGGKYNHCDLVDALVESDVKAANG